VAESFKRYTLSLLEKPLPVLVAKVSTVKVRVAELITTS